MSLRNYVSPYPQLSVNGPPPPHHRVQALPVSMALQQQISQQQAAAAQQQQTQSQGSAQSNQNSGGNVQTAPSHEYHLAQCLPFQPPSGANLTQNFIRHLSNGGYASAHQQGQAIYQTQGGPPGVVQNQQPSQPNSAQSLSNQQNQARLTPMTQPTAPPTPPNQQQPQQQPQYSVQMPPQGLQSGGNGNGNPRAQYRPQSQVQRGQPRQPQMNQQFIYQHNGLPYAVPFVFNSAPHVRPQYGYAYVPQPFNNYAAAPQGYQQMQASSNGQQRQSTPQAAVQTMAPSQTNDFSGYSGMEVYQSSMQAPTAPAQAPPQPQQKTNTVKRTASKAIAIINPVTGKNIFEDDSSAGGTGASIATVDKAITASHNELNKDEAVEKELLLTTSEPSTPVVSAISDGPSVEITPKHQINKSKKLKPPEPVAVTQTQQQPQQITSVPVISEPQSTKSFKTEFEAEPTVVQASKDNENNNVAQSSTLPTVPITPEPVVKVEAVKVVPVMAAVPLDINDTNNNNYQNAEQTPFESKEKVVKETAAPVTEEVDETPQDSNNNATDDKSIMTSPSIRQNASPAPTTEVENKLAPSRKISVIDYDDGQWSPENLAGKKYYTRDQLLKLKDHLIVPPLRLSDNVASTLMKNNKETLTNTLNQTMPPPNMANQGGGGVGGGGNNLQRSNSGFDPISGITPKFMSTMGNRNPYQSKRPSQQGNKQQSMPNSGRGSQSGIIKLSLCLQNDVKLNEAENAWKPSHLVKKQDMTEDERTTDDLLSRFRSMLNKLTAENFILLVDQVKTYKIDTSERLDGVISLVFEKAISEPKFAPTYANLCKEVAFITTAPHGEGQAVKKNTLKVKLITQCQKEFERHREESIVFNQIEAKLGEIDKITDPAQREDEKSRLEEEHYKMRQRANGTVKFIGELFKIDMLTSKIMRACIELLLQEVTEEKVERVCKLLTTIGAKMEKADGRSTLDGYFRKLTEMLHPNHKIIKSSRVKFEIQNLDDLRNSNWKARRIEAEPKSFDQIQQETDQEQQMINFQTRQNAKEDRQRGGNQGGYNRRQQQDNEGWQTQQNTKSRVTPIQFNKIALPGNINELPKFGAPADYQKFMPLGNKFQGLSVDNDADPPSRYGGGGSKNSSMERNNDRNSRYYNNNGDNRNHQNNRNERYSGRNSGSNQGSRNSSQNRSRDNSSGPGGPSRSLQAPRPQQQPISSNLSFSGIVKQPQKSQPASALSLEPMSREEVEKNYKDMLSIVNGYLDDKFTLEAATNKLKTLSINKDVLVEIYNKFLDRKDIDREHLMTLICGLMNDSKLTRSDNITALIDTMELAPDMMCDVPRVHEYIAQFFAEQLIASVLTFQDVLQICDVEIKSNQSFGEKVLGFIFQSINKRYGSAILKQVVSKANCDLGVFINDGNFNRWLEANKFTNTVQGTREDVITHVKQLLEAEKISAEVIIEYINSTKCIIDSDFIRDLTKAIIENCCEDIPGTACKVLNSRLEDLSLVFQRYIDNNRQLELTCIHTIHRFADDREYPPGLLNTIFGILYDNDAVSLEAFETWKQDDASEKGKGVAICSTRQFFTKLAEDKDEDDTDLGDEGES